MHPENQLAILAAFTGFLLKTSLGFCICWAISKIAVSPRRKFLVWFSFLVGAGCYWLWLAGEFVPHTAALVPIQMPAALGVTGPLGTWQIRPSWAFPLSIVLRGLGVLYLLVLGRLLLARVRKQMHLRWMMRFAYKAPEAIESFFRPIAEDLNAGNVRLLMLSGIHSPATFGWLRPVILLPPFCLEQGRSELRGIFHHELHHVRRRDFVCHTVGSLCRALLFFHPAAGYAMRRLGLESELACDLAAIGDSPERRATYAECLVRFARLNVADSPKPWNLDFAGSSAQLKLRIRSVLAGTPKIPVWMLGLRAMLGVLLFAVFLGAVPSLFIVLSYEQHRAAQSTTPTLLTTRTHVRRQRSGPLKSQVQEHPARRAFAISFSTVPNVAPTAAAGAPILIAPRNPAAIPSSGSWPTLKRRSDVGGATASKSVPTTDIVLASQPSSRGRKLITRGRSVAAIITAGTNQVAVIASHGRDRDDH